MVQNLLITNGCLFGLVKMFCEGELVSYKNIHGRIAFVCETSISIEISKGKHRSHDVRVVVGKSEFKEVIPLNSK